MALPPIQWPTTADEVKAKCDAVVAATEALYAEIAALPRDSLTFANVVSPLMCSPNYKTNSGVCESKFLQHCSTDESIRTASQASGERLAKLRVTCRMRKDVFEVVEAYSATEEAKSLGEREKHFLDALLQDFRRGGLGLDEEKRAQVEALLAEDTDVCSKYLVNVSSDTTKAEFTVEELKGLPADWIKERTNAETGKVVVTLKYPDTVPLAQHCEVAETRKKMALARESAYGNNLELMSQGVQIRKKLATLLGYQHYADYVTEKRMTKNAKTVTDFLSELHAKLLEPGKKELARLVELKRVHCAEIGAEFDGKLNSWDMGFYNELLMQREYGVNDEEIKEYFPLDHVVTGTLSIYEDLLSLKFTEIHGFQTWHPEVRCFTVHDTGSQDLLGHFYLDLHPRDGKYSHAAIFHLLKTTNDHGSVACMLANLPGPSPDGTVARLRHGDVETFFHEFGHIMHDLCSEGVANMTRLAKCPRDFVEAPSQMLENWCWQEEVLKKLSSHHKTKESLPMSLLQNLIKAKHVNVSLNTLRQVYLSTLDMTLHTEAPEDLQGLVDRLRPELSLMENPPGANMLRSWMHLMNQYAAAYYGYLWSEVLSADMFDARFQKEGVLNATTGMDYRKMVLAPGGVGSIMDHLTRFLGRKPEQGAFLRTRGIA